MPVKDQKNATVSTVKTEDEQGKALELHVKMPSPQVLQDAQYAYASAWAIAINRPEPLMLRAKLEKVLRRQGLWDDEKDQEQKDLEKQIDDTRLTIRKGGISQAEVRELAVKVIKLQHTLQRLLSQRRQMDEQTAEAIADNAQFNYMVSECVFDARTGLRYFKDRDDYIKRMNEKASSECARKLFQMIYSIDESVDENLPEIKVLRAFKMIDKDKNFIDKQGRKVNINGKLINEKGQLINEQQELVNEQGELVDEQGNPIIKSEPFLDENGEAVYINFGEDTANTENAAEKPAELPTVLAEAE